jgi:hypothetical protein
VTLSSIQLIPFTGITAEPLMLVTILGALCVVTGSVMTATAKNTVQAKLD